MVYFRCTSKEVIAVGFRSTLDAYASLVVSSPGTIGREIVRAVTDNRFDIDCALSDMSVEVFADAAPSRA